MMLLSVLVAFAVPSCFAFTTPTPPAAAARRLRRPFSRRFSSEGGADDLTNTLARLDQQWKIQQSTQPKSRWTKLVLNDDGVTEEAPEDSPPSTPPIMMHQQDFVYLLEPPNKSIPSCLIVFTGGAGLGTYPQIAYNELLLRISNRLNAAVITAPYTVGLDHFALAKQTGELTRRAIIHCQDDKSRLYPANLPTYSLSHSLGAKLACIYIAATNQNYDNVGLISFNNFSFGKTIGMAKEFAATIRQSTGLGSNDNAYAAAGGGVTEEALNSLFNFAEMAVSATGIDFSPSSTEMERLIELKYSEMVDRTRLFAFDEDTLENTQEFVNACRGGRGPKVSGLPGTHLTPVYFKLGLDEMEIPEEAREMASEAMGGFQSASFGNEEELELLVNEVCDWIMGKEPSRKPAWLRERPQLAAEATDDASSSRGDD